MWTIIKTTDVVATTGNVGNCRWLLFLFWRIFYREKVTLLT